MTVQDDATSGVNTTGTNAKIDTPLTQLGSPNVLRDLLVKRNRVGANTREGKLLSNLIKQVQWQDQPESNRSWATHPTQNLPWMMGMQLKLLAKQEH